MEEQRFAPYLKELAGKYTAAGPLRVTLENGAVRVEHAAGACRFYYDFSLPPAQSGAGLPLLHWRAKRRYAELRGIVEQGFIGRPLAIRIHHIVPRDEFGRSLQDLVSFEADLAEWLTGQRVERVFADFSGADYVNCIFCTGGGVRVSLELGFSPAGSQPVLLHEVIGREGVASDVAVDTQTQQYPVYVLRGGETVTYADLDAELYGLENTQADGIRFILGVLREPEEAAALRAAADHLQAVWQATVRSGKTTAYTKVEV